MHNFYSPASVEQFTVYSSGIICLMFAISYLCGRLLKFRGVNAIAGGAGLFFGVANMSLLLMQKTQWSLGLYWLVFLLMLLCLSVLFRPWVKRLDKVEVSLGRWGMLLFLGSISLFYYKTASELFIGPNTQIQFFQGWYPSYISESINLGFLADYNNMNLGKGFLTSAMAYAPNSLGSILFFTKIFQFNPYVVYIASHVFLIALCFLLFFSMLQKAILLQTLLVLLLFVLGLSNPVGYYWLVQVASDELLIFAIAYSIFMFTVCFGKLPIHKVLLHSAFPLTFAVFGRNYGLLYFAVMFACYMVFELVVGNNNWKALRENLTLLLAPIALSLPEVIRVLTSGDLFYPRTNVLKVFPPSLGKSALGIIDNTAIFDISNKAEISLNPGSLFWILLLVFLAYFYFKAKKSEARKILWILIFLVPPVLIEALTGYRKSIEFSKIFVGSVWVVTIFPVFVLLQVKRLSRSVKDHKVYNAMLVFSFVWLIVWSLTGRVSGVNGVYKFHQMKNSFKVLRTKENSGGDLAVVQALKSKLTPEQWSSIVNSPIIYVHYEYGMAFRWFAGGEIFKDYDFWSDSIQEKLASSQSMDEFLRKTSCAPIYFSQFKNPPHYQDYVTYPFTPWFWKEVDGSESQKLFSKVVKINQSRFYLPNLDICSKSG